MKLPPQRIPARHMLAVSLATVHLVLVACSAAHLQPLPGERFPGSLLQAYAQWSGASSRFSFFAPGVTPEMRVSFEVQRGSGEVMRDDFQFAHDEVNLRIHSMMLRFGLKEVQDLLARSWAAAMFGRHPDARTVTVIVELFRLPAMAAYRSGDQPGWNEYYRALFERRPSSRSSQTQTAHP